MSEESIVDLFEPAQEVSSAEEETVEIEESSEVSEEVEAKEPETKEEVSEAKEAPTASEESKDKQDWTYAAVKDERAKRQKLEAELEEMRAKLDGGDKPMPDVIEDQEGFVKSLEQKYEERLYREKIEIYRQTMAENNPDYLEKEEKFIELAKENPMLLAQMNKSTNPAKFAYEQMIKYEQFQEMQDIDAFREKIRAEEQAKLAEQQQSEKASEDEQAGNLSPSLAKARGVTEKAEKLTENPGDLF